MRGWLLAAVGVATPLAAAAQTPGRPAVRVVGVRPMDDATPAARSQGPAQPPPPGLPVPRPFGPSAFDAPRPAVTAAPATPAPPAGVSPFPTAGPMPPAGYNHGLFPTPNLDPPLYDGCAPGPTLLAGGPVVTKWWASAEYLGWWTRSARFPALLTTSSPAFNGILGTGDARVIFGDGTFGDTLHGGGRFAGGYWFGCEQRFGLDGSVFFLGRNGETYRTNTGTFPLIARPFTNLNQNVPFAQLVAAPGLATGGAAVTFENSLWGADANVRWRLAGTCCSRLDLLAGGRYVRLAEELRVNELFARTANSPPSIGVPTASSGLVFDKFRTENQFYGGQMGLQGEVRRGRWFTNLTAKVALGTVYQTVEIDGGQTILNTDGTVGVARGGLLAVPGANIGTFKRNKFAVVPEAGLQVGYHLTPYFRVFAGYNFLYLSSVLRPGDQIDTGLDVTRIPNFPVAGAVPLPDARPRVSFKDTDFFAQGLSFGLQFTW